jgi:hypothetical protein
MYDYSTEGAIHDQTNRVVSENSNDLSRNDFPSA